MRIKLDAKVRTKDGQGAGHVKRVIWDPKTNEVTAFVIATGGLLGHDVLIGRDVLESATFDGEQIVIDMTKDEVAMPSENFGIAGDREIRTQFQGSLSQDGGRGVVYRDECTALVSSGNEFGEITHIQPWIARCF